MPKNKIPIQPAEPFDYSRLYGPEKYNLDNMTLKSVNMPAYIVEGEDRADSLWWDRDVKKWEEASKDLASTCSADAFYSGVSDADLLAFAKKMTGWSDVTGARVVRFTNGFSQYPALRLDVVYTKEPRPLYRAPTVFHFDSYDEY